MGILLLVNNELSIYFSCVHQTVAGFIAEMLWVLK